MTRTKKIWIFLIALWLLVWAVFAIEMISPQQGLSISRVFYLVTGPLVIGLGIWWIRRE